MIAASAWQSSGVSAALRFATRSRWIRAISGDRHLRVLALGEPVTRTYHHDLGEVEVYLEPHLPPERLVVVSATDSE